MTEQRLTGVVAPGNHLRREIDARGWSQVDLAEILGRPLQAVNQILKGKKSITAATARELEGAMSIPAVTWLNLESQYRLSLEAERDDKVRQRAELFSRAPVADLRRRGWVRNTRDIAELKKDVLQLLRIDSLVAPPQIRFAARKSTDYQKALPEQEAWCGQAFRLATQMKGLPKFVKGRFEQGLVDLRRLCKARESIKHIPDALRKLGVRLLVVEHLPRTKIDGATFWLSPGQPVVVLSLRYSRVDHFLFTLFHELIHVRYQDAQSLDNDLLNEGDDTDLPEKEIRANKEAAELLVPMKELASFIEGGVLSRSAIIAFATKIGIHPGVVLGQLQHRGLVGWSASRDLLEPIREIIVQTVQTDGWNNRSTT